MNQIDPNKIFLIGMPGSGKSTIGKRLATKLNFTFYDLDQLIEISSNSSIFSLFENLGENGFRELEKDVLFSFIKSCDHPFILATGGGTVINDQSLLLINQTGISIYLKCTVHTLLSRLSNTANSRPLLKQHHMVVDIPILLKNRETNYLNANIVLSADGSMDEIINDLVNKL